MAMQPGMPQEAAEPNAQAPEAAPAEGGGGADQFTDLITNISDGLAMLTDAISSSGMAPDAAKALQGLNDQYKQIVDQLMASSGGDSAEPPPGSAPQAAPGMGSPEAAGAKGGAVPVGAAPKGAIPVGRR